MGFARTPHPPSEPFCHWAKELEAVDTSSRLPPTLRDGGCDPPTASEQCVPNAMGNPRGVQQRHVVGNATGAFYKHPSRMARRSTANMIRLGLAR